VRELLTGANAVVRGALAAGCDFFAGYPITPATPILLQMMQELPRFGGVAIQGEDEIASIGMCIGAAAAGRRALTATSGPGLSLYSENIGLALMAELPLVIVDVQRLGPATGGATMVGQGDVQFARWGTAGGYPLIVLAPSTVPECATLTMEAFELAERFRCPVLLLSDKELNLTLATVEMPDLGVEAGAPVHPVDSEGRLTESGRVPRSPAFGEGRVVRFTGSTHDERQMMTKDAAAVDRLNARLVAKIEDHRDELERVRCDLTAGAATLLISYGTSAGAMEAGMRMARAQGKHVSTAVVQSLWPVPKRQLSRAAEGASRIVVGELNPGLYVREICCLFPDKEVISLQRTDGQLLTPQMVLERCL
jgi:2-oxoglutarate/2-oxoacid ferredoxin oxidoreductase subunit alpha